MALRDKAEPRFLWPSALPHLLRQIDRDADNAVAEYEKVMSMILIKLRPAENSDILYESKQGHTIVYRCKTCAGRETMLVVKEAPLATRPSSPRLQFIENGEHFEFSSPCNLSGCEHTCFTVSPYCEGGDLFTHVRDNGPGTPAKLRSVIWRVVMQVAYLSRENNIVHCDIKLENIWIKNGICYLADFGLAKQLTNRLNHIQCGSDYYVPIESKEPGAVNPPEKHDAWGVGATLYAFICRSLLTGPDWNRCDYEKQVARLELTLSEYKVEDYAIRFIQRTLDMNPETRPGSSVLDLLLVLYIWRYVFPEEDY